VIHGFFFPREEGVYLYETRFEVGRKGTEGVGGEVWRGVERNKDGVGVGVGVWKVQMACMPWQACVAGCSWNTEDHYERRRLAGRKSTQGQARQNGGGEGWR